MKLPGELLVSRRSVLKAGAGLTFAIAASSCGMRGTDAPGSDQATDSVIGAWVRICTDGSIVIHNPAAEMGQGSMTALPVIVAEEMDADWARVCVDFSPIEPDVYGWIPWGNSKLMLTVASHTVRGYFPKLRIVGAQIRKVLLDSVAKFWNVPVTELTTEPSTVVHAGSDRRISFGEIAAFAEVPARMPDIDESQLKSPSEFRIIGHSVPRNDIPAKVDGSAEFSIDVQVPGMLYGMVTRSPVHNGQPLSYNESDVRAMDGVVATVKLEHGIGIIAESVEVATKARATLNIEWAKGAQAEGFDSDMSLAGYAEIPGSGQAKAKQVVSKGDVSMAFAAATKRYESDFLADHVYHAQMEPLNAVVSVSEAGDAVEAWVGTQATARAKLAIAETLGIGFDRVDFYPCYLGGGFGRRADVDYVVEATHLSNEVKRPVKLIWSREDDLQYGQYRPMNLQRLAAAVDGNGNISAWEHCVIGDGGRLLTSGVGIPFYDIPNQNIETCPVSHGLRLRHWRSVGHGFNKFAIEAFVDEIASDLGTDPYQFRRTLLGKSPRALNVLDSVAELADWKGNTPEGRAKGIAFAEQGGSLAAGVAEISVDESNGKIRVHRFWCVVDGGIIVQPDNAKAQIEGGVVMGLSSALFERISLKNGLVQQSNFHDYRTMRMSEAPEIEVAFVNSEEPPSGLGEIGVPTTAGAVASAFAALTGKRLRHLPFTSDRVRANLRG